MRTLSAQNTEQLEAPPLKIKILIKNHTNLHYLNDYIIYIFNHGDEMIQKMKTQQKLFS